MGEKKNEPLIPEYIPPKGAKWPLNEREESDLDRAKRRLQEAREKSRSRRSTRSAGRSNPEKDLGEAMQKALGPFGANVEEHFQRLLNLGLDLAENKLRDVFGIKKK
jgi:hypothetical protein